MSEPEARHYVKHAHLAEIRQALEAWVRELADVGAGREGRLMPLSRLSRRGITAMRGAIVYLMALTLSTVAVAQSPESPINVTAFAAAAIATGPHPAIGVAIGVRPRPGPVSLEFEFSRSRSDPTAGVPAIVTFAGNLLVQWPLRPSRIQFYGTFGIGAYVLVLDEHSGEPDDARDFGGGVKVTLAGPLKFRMDYRAFRLAPISGEYHSNEQRFYVGIVAGF
jgi:hypothetical protein